MIYFVVFTISIILSYIASQNERNKAVFFFFSLLAVLNLVIFAGYRDETVGWDVQTYPILSLQATAQTSPSDFFTLTGIIEPMYLLLAWISNIINGKLSTLLLLTQGIITTCFYIAFIRLRKEIPIGVSMFFFCFLMYNMGLNIMRHELAMSLVFLGATYLRERKLKIFIIYVCIAFLFHKSALMAFLLIPFLYVENKRIAQIVIIGFIVSFFLYTTLIMKLSSFQGFEKFETYTDKNAYGSAFSYSEFIIRIILVLLLYKNIRKKDKEGRKILLMFIGESFLNLFQLKSAFVGRIGYYFYMMYLLYIPIYLMKTKLSLNIHQSFSYIIIPLVVLFWWYVNIYSLAGATYPYSSKILGI